MLLDLELDDGVPMDYDESTANDHVISPKFMNDINASMEKLTMNSVVGGSPEDNNIL